MRSQKALAQTILVIWGALVLARGVSGGPRFSGQGTKTDLADQAATAWKKFLGQRSAELRPQRIILRDSLFGSLDGSAQHGVGVWYKMDEVDYVEGALVEVYQIEPRTANTQDVKKISELRFDHVRAFFDKLNGRDINGDGLKELVFILDSEAACWTCWHIELYHLRDGRLEELPLDVADRGIKRSSLHLTIGLLLTPKHFQEPLHALPNHPILFASRLYPSASHAHRGIGGDAEQGSDLS